MKKIWTIIYLRWRCILRWYFFKEHNNPEWAFQLLASQESSQCLYYGVSYRVTADGSTLNIYGALPSNVGKYTCIATNPAGEEDRIFNLNVYGKYDISLSFDSAPLGIYQ